MTEVIKANHKLNIRIIPDSLFDGISEYSDPMHLLYDSP
jgi:hypothetical protein